MRRLLPWVLLALSSCTVCGAQQQDDLYLCDQLYGTGPDGTLGECGIFQICLPSTLASCTGDACCHTYCAADICPPNSPCITLNPAQLPDGGPPGCGCTDGGACTCAPDGGNCVASACLDVCSSAG